MPQPRLKPIIVPEDGGKAGAGVPKDKDTLLAAKVLKAAHNLQLAMDQAVLSGLIVEPSFQITTNDFEEYGASVETHMCKIKIYRKLV